MISGIILEGIPGSGKTQVIEAMQSHAVFSFLFEKGKVFYESETLGEILDKLKNSKMRHYQLCFPLHRVLRHLKRESTSGTYRYILERFHPTYYALMPEWELYQEIDGALKSLNCTVILLTFNPEKIERRCLDRVDRQDCHWGQKLAEYFGSWKDAIQALALFQKRRWECLSMSSLPYIEIDTTVMDWPAYALQVIDYLKKENARNPKAK